MEVVYFGSDPRKTHLGSGKVIYRRKEVNKECVNKQVTAWATGFLLAGSLWERELLQLMGNALGHLSTNSLRGAARENGVLCPKDTSSGSCLSP